MPRTAATPSMIIRTATHSLTEFATPFDAPAFWDIRAIPQAKRVPKTAITLTMVKRSVPSLAGTDARLGEPTEPETLRRTPSCKTGHFDSLREGIRLRKNVSEARHRVYYPSGFLIQQSAAKR